MLGLDNAGKTTIFYNMKNVQILEFPPIIGFNIEKAQYHNAIINSWDLGSGARLRPLWRHFYKTTQGIIFVINSSDRERIEEFKEWMYNRTLNEEELAGLPILILANKQDLEGMGIGEIAEILQLKSIINRKWYIQGCCARTGEELEMSISSFLNIVLEEAKDKIKDNP